MKQKDFALIAVIIIVSAVISLLAAKAIFVPPANRQQTVEVVKPITADFPKPDNRYFNETAFDPTKQITVEENANNEPFSATETP